MSEHMSQIYVSCNDQLLKITKAPVIASGGLNEVRVVFDFCEKWNGFVKTALFYRDEENIYYSVLDDNDTCVLPWEVCYEDGKFYFSVIGEKENIRRTSSIVRYSVTKGVISTDWIPSDPTPEIYDQIIAMYAEIKELTKSFREEAMEVIEATNVAKENAEKAVEQANAANEATLQAQERANTAAESANEAATAANNAASDAEAATEETIAARDSFLETAGEAIQTITELLGNAEYGPVIVCKEGGSVISLSDSSDRLLKGLTLYGKTTQDGTPTPEAPVELVTAGASGSIVLTITDGTDENKQTITVQTPNGLPGIPVESGGNYTDENGQQWICDEIDFARGVYVQRVRNLDFSTFTWKRTAYSNEVQKGYYATVNGFYKSRHNFFHTHYRWLGYTCGSEAGANAVGATQSAFNARTIGEIGFCSKSSGQDNFAVVVGINDGTPVGILQLVCVEPIETPLTAEELAQYAALHSNKPNTMVYNDAGAGMKIAYVADTKLYIDKKFNELAAAIVNNA